MKTEIQLTADGSPTLYRADIDEHYHSVKGAETESLHVYIKEGLDYFASQQQGPVRVLEVGFGTGLNAALAAEWACRNHRRVHYVSLELYPVAPDLTARLNYDARLLTEVNAAQWDTLTAVGDCFDLDKRVADFLTCPLPDGIDVVFFDAFAPEKQPEMWSREAIGRVVAAMSPGAVFVTYCAKGAIRRMLQDLGLTPQRIPGPPGGKREILRAVRLQ